MSNSSTLPSTFYSEDGYTGTFGGYRRLVNEYGLHDFLKQTEFDTIVEEKMNEINKYVYDQKNAQLILDVREIMKIIDKGLTEATQHSDQIQRLRDIWTSGGEDGGDHLDAAIKRYEELRKQILGEKSKEYYLINEQTRVLEDGIQRMMNDSTTNNKKNYYQLEQNKNIAYIYKLMFWFYYLFVLVFILVLFVLSKSFFVTKIVLSLLFVVFPFLILPLEYVVVFVFYYLYSFVMATPFRTSNLPMTMPTHSFEYVPTNVLDFKNF